MKHKIEDYKIRTVEYYLLEDKSQEKFVKYSNVLQEV
jgi:hypothetical protein